MTGFDIAVQAYINEHGSITLDAYSALSEVFLEWRDPDIKDEVQASLSGMEKQQMLNSLKAKFVERATNYYNTTCVGDAKNEMEKRARGNNSKVDAALKKCKSKFNEQAGLVINLINNLIKDFIGLSNPAGDKLIKILSCKDYTFETHKAIISLCQTPKDQLVQKVRDVRDNAAKKIMDAAKEICDTAAWVVKSLIKVATHSLFVLAVAGMFFSFNPLPGERQSSFQQRYEDNVHNVPAQLGLGLVATVGAINDKQNIDELIEDRKRQKKKQK